jgi:hypothetical protein
VNAEASELLPAYGDYYNKIDIQFAHDIAAEVSHKTLWEWQHFSIHHFMLNLR